MFEEFAVRELVESSITVGHMKRMRTFEQPILRIHFFVCLGDVSTIRLCPFYPCLRVATLRDSIYTERSMIMQRVIFRFLFFPVLNSGHFIWTTLNCISCLLVFPRSRLKASSAVCQLCQLVPARVLE